MTVCSIKTTNKLLVYMTPAKLSESYFSKLNFSFKVTVIHL